MMMMMMQAPHVCVIHDGPHTAGLTLLPPQAMTSKALEQFCSTADLKL
jgi:hypothetical protein